MQNLSRDVVLTPEMQERTDLDVPPPHVFNEPETVLQFGTGGFLRGFVDAFLDAALRDGLYGGRVVVVGSTGSGRTAALNAQDGLYTVRVQGLGDDGTPLQTTRVMGAVSRAISSQDDWNSVLDLATVPALDLVVSNTTEVGIRLDEDDRPDRNPPRSFPGKLTAFLHARAEAFDYDEEAGLVILPCELVTDNGDRLHEIIHTLSEQWGYGPRFAAWLDDANHFCNTLVDRIVPGAPPDDVLADWQADLGYRDQLVIAAETYRLWAIEADPNNEALRDRLAWTDVDDGIVLTDDIAPYRERKVRILNGTHTIAVPAAYLAGADTVHEATQDPLIGPFMRRVMAEIAPTLDAPGAASFADAVWRRFSNPFIEHRLLDITFQATTKLGVRVVPTLQRYATRHEHVPPAISLGFAAYLLFMRGGTPARNGYALRDDHASTLERHGKGGDIQDPAARRAFVKAVAEDGRLWNTRLDALPGFVEAVSDHFDACVTQGVRGALQRLVEDPGPHAGDGGRMHANDG